ncbi:MAG: protease SohB [Gammaproteobacteria bacterium]|nr:protease SohB [Gammaproteobacteria bacterium]MDE0443190.1 protease SohB [Gammaproteobacteria bacterium]
MDRIPALPPRDHPHLEFLFDYLGFFAKTATIVVAVLIILSAVTTAAAQRAMRGPPMGHIQVIRLNELLHDMRRAIEDAGLPRSAAKKQRKRDAKARKKQKHDEARRRVFVLSFEGDMAASGVDSLRREISAVLGTAKDEDEVLVRVDSAGGMVHGYGLAASQLARIRGKGVTLTVAVDKIAASGGYMMAAVADRILAAPFAVVGSIGVVAQIPNVHRLLKKHDVDVEVLTAGRYKRTLDVLGENTDEGREKLRDELHDVHALFQEFIGNYRPGLDLETVSTGEAWFGQRALDRSLVDELVTSDEYLAAACDEADILEVTWVQPKKPIERLFGQTTLAVGKLIDRLVDRTMGGLR